MLSIIVKKIGTRVQEPVGVVEIRGVTQQAYGREDLVHEPELGGKIVVQVSPAGSVNKEVIDAIIQGMKMSRTTDQFGEYQWEVQNPPVRQNSEPPGRERSSIYRIFEVSYDLRTYPTPNYDGLYAELKTFPGWCRVLEHTWFVYTDLTAVHVYNRVCGHLKKGDFTWVNELGESYGWLPKNVWDWLENARRAAKNANGPRAGGPIARPARSTMR